MAMNFADALDTKASDIERPPVLPQGTYVWTVSKVPVISTSNSGEWDIIEFPLRAVSAESDVDEDELAAFGSLNAAMNRMSFMFPTAPEKDSDRKRTLFNLKRFLLETLRVEGDDDTTIKELLAGAINCQFMAIAKWRQVDDATYVDVKSPAPLD